jgi:hypothetical protein
MKTLRLGIHVDVQNVPMSAFDLDMNLYTRVG